MDPASIVGLVSACSSLTKQCASVVKTLHDLVATYKYAELAILSIVQECETVQFAWRRIAQRANENLQQVEDFEELRERLQRSIYCGEVVMSALEEELSTVYSNSHSFKRRIGLLWNNSVFLEHQARLRGQVAALQLLLQVLNLPRKEDRLKVLTVKEKIFSDADESVLSIIPSDRSTCLPIEGNRHSFESDGSDCRYIRFSFENALFTSHMYKRNYRFSLMKPKTQKDPVLESPAQELAEARPDESETRAFTGDFRDKAEDNPTESLMVQLHEALSVEDSSRPTTVQTNTDAPEPVEVAPNIAQSTVAPSKKTIQQLLLYNALSHANVAVLLDNVQNFEGAIKSYESACKALDLCTTRCAIEDDKCKLNSICVISRNRIKELWTLLPHAF